MPISSEMARRNGKLGGRPKGSTGALAKISEHKARELSAKGETPLDVMIDNMNFWRGRANDLTETMKTRLEDLSKFDISNPKQRAAFIEAIREFNKAATYMIAAREKAQSCAVDAAPYVHPRLTAVAVKDLSNPQGKIKFSLQIGERGQMKASVGVEIDGQSGELISAA